MNIEQQVIAAFRQARDQLEMHEDFAGHVKFTLIFDFHAHSGEAMFSATASHNYEASVSARTLDAAVDEMLRRNGFNKANKVLSLPRVGTVFADPNDVFGDV